MVNTNKKGAQGIGTLIIFIAMILVAAVAAGVLIQTASSLQSKSLDVGRQSQEKITTDIEVVQVYARDTSDNAINGSAGDLITLVVRLGSGSSPINFNDLLLKFDTKANSQTTTINQSVITGTPTYDSNSYGVKYLVGGKSLGYLESGDMAEVYFTVKNGTTVVEGESATIRLLSKNGAVKPVDLTTPASMIETTTYLYP